MDIPFIGLRATVPSAWIDVNGHVNATRYGLIVYDAHARFTDELGLGDQYVESTSCGKAVVASTIIYEHELVVGSAIEVRSYLPAVDHKRLHFFYEIFDLSNERRAATGEQVDVHIDLRTRRSAPLPMTKLTHLQSIVRATHAGALPDGMGDRVRPPENRWLRSES